MDKLEILRKSEVFSSLNDEQLKLVSKVSKPETFEPGAIICKQDTKLDNIYVIEEGLVGIILEAGPLSQRQVQSATRFEVVGWSALTPPYVSTATAKAVEKTKVIAVDANELGRLFRSNPELMYKVGSSIACLVAKRLRSAYSQLLGVTSQDE